MTRELKGRHVLLIALAAFGTIIAANMALLFAATGTFPGLVVKNAYVASQGWDDRTGKQRALGWSATVKVEEGKILLTLTNTDGSSVIGVEPVVTVGRPTTDQTDRAVQVAFDGQAYVGDANLAPGRWRVEITVNAPVTFAATTEILVREVR